jgi:NAD(P)-dependent dehydrogenase (short-subunit alcohol dehydrogenase family)
VPVPDVSANLCPRWATARGACRRCYLPGADGSPWYFAAVPSGGGDRGFAGQRTQVPAQGCGVPHDLSGIAVFLASKASDFVTGAAIPVDGGYSVQV